MNGSPVFVCPRTRGPLKDWYSQEGHVTYPLVDGVPVLVPEPVAAMGRGTPRKVDQADATRAGFPDAITPHLPPSLFAAPAGFGQWLASLGDNGPDAVCATLAARHGGAGPALDVGCGVGPMARRMVAMGRPTWAFDVSVDAVLLARGLLCGQLPQTTIPTHRNGLRRVKVPFKPITQGLTFCVADAVTPPFLPESFRWVHLGDVLDHAGDAVGDVLVSSAELVAPGGIFTVTTSYATPGEPSETAPPPDDELLEAFEGLGLQVVEQQDRVPHIVREYDRSYRVRFMHCVAAKKR
ncbi:MAG: methyltransferase domain-containing protein [Myxococcota bacterium]